MLKQTSARLFKNFDRICWVVAALISIVSLIGFLGKLNWMLDLFSHFRVQYFQLALIFAGICLWVRRNKLAALFASIAIFNYIFIYPLYFNKPKVPDSAPPPARAMLMNLNASNGNTDLVLSAITNVNPDILLLVEVTPDWAFELAELDAAYPHHILEPREGCFGMILLSKYPLERGKVEILGSADVPSIITEVHLPQGAISLIGTHPLPPVVAPYAEHRNNQLAALAHTAQKQKLPVLLLGDLNVSPWSVYFKKLIRESGLKDSTKGFGFQPTWPARKPFIRIPIDHALHAPEILIHQRAVGADVGSDHFPIIIDFSLK